MAVTTLLAKTVFDATGDEFIRDGFVQIENGKIKAIGRREDLGSAASGARDLGDATILPGLVNMHTHLTLSGSRQCLHDALYDTYEQKMMRAVEHARQAIMSGVTTIRDCGTLDSIVFSVRQASADGLIAAPHVWASGNVLTSTGGHCYFFGNEVDTVEEARRAVREQVKAGADFVKVMATGGGLTPNTNPREAQFDEAQMKAIVEDSARLGRYVAAHCHGTPGIRNAVAAQVRTIEHCSFMVPDGVHYEQPVADEVAEKGIYVCPTFGVGERARQWMEQEGIDNPFAATRNQRVDSLRKLWDTGVKFVSGNDAGVTMTRFDDFQLDLELLVEHVGASSAQAIRTGTSQAAEAIGSDDFGSLAPGKRADILAVRGNAMDDIGALRNILLVLKSGQAMVDNA
ncbi:MAG TPA: amidohydrolase [Chloroflexi bacterium]|jgi:imidazolonepropionase-like amidohydrolase|nr:amidohydrolase [Chloroflexota bacterium]HCG30896.1 amidohydrolase [Chloroflexota bacterium]HRA32969.1 amidohydrolase family protein [Thermomicrobiales bacterium]